MCRVLDRSGCLAIACRGWGRRMWFQMIGAYCFVLNKSIGQV